jgi:lipopolysaccharide export system protein LptA
MATVAGSFEINRQTGVIRGLDSVQTELKQEGTPLVISAARLHFDSETKWATYQGNPRVFQGKNEVSGKKVMLNGVESEMVVEGDVRTRLFGDEGQSETYLVTSEKVRFDRPANTVLYEGSVVAVTEQFTIEGPFVSLLVNEEDNQQWGRLRQIHGWGGVRLEEETRVAIGDECYYFPDGETVTVAGDPAEVVDEEEGRATGAKLTYQIGQEKLVIEGQKAKP